MNYLAREAFEAHKEARASANDGFMHVVRVAAASDDEIRVIAGDEQATTE